MFDAYGIALLVGIAGLIAAILWAAQSIELAINSLEDALTTETKDEPKTPKGDDSVLVEHMKRGT